MSIEKYAFHQVFALYLETELSDWFCGDGSVGSHNSHRANVSIRIHTEASRFEEVHCKGLLAGYEHKSRISAIKMTHYTVYVQKRKTTKLFGISAKSSLKSIETN